MKVNDRVRLIANDETYGDFYGLEGVIVNVDNSRYPYEVKLVRPEKLPSGVTDLEFDTIWLFTADEIEPKK